MTLLLLALDFGGTKHAAALVTAGERKWLAHQSTLSPPNADASTDLKIMHELIHSLLKVEQLAAIGVSFGGPVEASTGNSRCPNF